MTQALFGTSAELGGSQHWRFSRDGDPIALELYLRHYSARAYQDRRERRLFLGPGEKLVLVAHDDSAIFGWRRMLPGASMDGQEGINCAVFRNEGRTLSSQLIREADEIADARWPGERHYTYVAPERIRSSNPGFCFVMAGWRRAGWTKGGHGRDRLIILERPA